MTDSNHNPQFPTDGPQGRDRLDQVLEDLVAGAPFRRSPQGDSGPGSKAAGGRDCPPTAQWLMLACGNVAADEQKKLVAHAAVCTYCLKLLRQGERAISGDVLPEELEQLQQYQAVSPQWQHRLAVELARTPYQRSGFRLPKYFGWATTGLAAACALVVSVAIWQTRANAPEKLLADAYSQSRSFDLRIPGAAFAPVTPQTHLRGAGGDHESAPLLSARASIDRKLDRSPQDLHLQQMQARAQLLNEQYDQAIDTLDRLIAAGPVTASLLLDDGTAYFLRGTATGSENDRATALDDLRRADELDPSDPVVLFNEALMMEDRGQVMNAVETWNRFLKFEKDPKWLDEGHTRLKSLEEKLNQLKTHQSRMEQHLRSPDSMRALAADSKTLAEVDEELSTTLLPHLLDAAFPLPGDRSRGSPCADECLAARSLLTALANSLQRNHQDSWLSEFLPSGSSPIPINFSDAAQLLSKAIDANARGDYESANAAAASSRTLFQNMGNDMGASRSAVEQMYALQRSYTFARCQSVVASLKSNLKQSPWLAAQKDSLQAACFENLEPSSPSYQLLEGAARRAESAHYTLLQLRLANLLSGIAIDAGDTETSWRLILTTLRRFYSGDYPAFRAATTMSGLAFIEESSPRRQLDLALYRESVGLMELTKNRNAISVVRLALARSAIRAGSLSEAKAVLDRMKDDAVLAPNKKGLRGGQAEDEIGMANLYLDRGDLASAGQSLDAANNHMVGEDNGLQLRNYAAARGRLDLAQGKVDEAEGLLTHAILVREAEITGKAHQEVVLARQDRDLYATLVAVWFVQKRPPSEILALWERYRLRVLGKIPMRCQAGRLNCLEPAFSRVLASGTDGHDSDVIGQVVLSDRLLVYRVHGNSVDWHESSVSQEEVLNVSATLTRAVSSPSTSDKTIDQAARRAGDLFLSGMDLSDSRSAVVLLEPDTILGDIPWPAVVTRSGPIGLQVNLEESPSIALGATARDERSSNSRPLVIGASVGAGEAELLPEALQEARAVAETEPGANVLLAAKATEENVLERLTSASVIHFAGHAAQQNGSTRLLLAPSKADSDKPYLDNTAFTRNPPRAARLIVFSACTTGRREPGWDHGMGDIVDTLESLGVPEVVATRWRIDSASAVPMMQAFYSGLAAGDSVPQALTAARESLARDARFRHPYYWASYYASGVGSNDLHEVFHGNRK